MRLLSALEVCQQAWASPAVPAPSSSIRNSSSLASSSSSSPPLSVSRRVGSPCSDLRLWSGRPSWLQVDSTRRNCRGLVKAQSAFPTTPALISSVSDLYEFICAGPLMQKLGYSPEKVSEKIDEWVECGVYLCRLFKLNDLMLTIPQKARIYHYYIPVFLWCEDQVERHRAAYKEGEEIPPLVIGVSAPQGSGKTTLVFALDFLFRRTGRNSATLSIDDFYLTADDQAELRSQNPGNALLELRGNAGSHDLPFSIETLTTLTKLTKEGDRSKLPRYDKSAFGGRGDRADPSTWPEVEGPLTVILFEGWMLGFKPLADEVVRAVDPQLEVVNKNLYAYYDAWDKFITSWIVIKIQDPSCVYQWRLEVSVESIQNLLFHALSSLFHPAACLHTRRICRRSTQRGQWGRSQSAFSWWRSTVRGIPSPEADLHSGTATGCTTIYALWGCHNLGDPNLVHPYPDLAQKKKENYTADEW